MESVEKDIFRESGNAFFINFIAYILKTQIIDIQ
jgi:hypothetical protein